MTKINWKCSKNLHEKQENPDFLERGDSAEVVFTPQQQFFLEDFDSCPGLGRVAVMDSINWSCFERYPMLHTNLTKKQVIF